MIAYKSAALNMTGIFMDYLTTPFVAYVIKKKVKCSRYKPGVTQRVGRVIALLFYDRGTRRG